MRKIFVLGSLNIDLSINCDKFPLSGETVIGKNFISNPGGKGANQAVAAAKMGGNVIMLGAVGNDFFGKKIKKNISAFHVNNTYIMTKEGATGVAIIVVNNGDNRIVLDSGANYQYNYADFEKTLTKRANPGDYFITQLENRVDVVSDGLKLAKKLGMITVLNPAPAFKLNDEIYKNCDYIIPNEAESRVLSNLYDDNTEEVIKYFLSKGVKNVIITLGEKGCVYTSNQNIKYLKAVDTKAIDTTAAGDTFIGALVAKLSDGCNLEDAINFANLASAITITRQGAQQSIPTKSEVEEYNNK
ncbi:MAG: ribokinase [Bacilli bacterium]|nr:ribokinase [Bacilli bacterium]